MGADELDQHPAMTRRKPWADRASRHERGYGSQWQRLRLRILARDQYLCQPCYTKGRVTAAAQVDHIKPKVLGGTDDPSNLQSICSECHQAKSLREAAEAQGRTTRHRARIGVDGWPVE